MRSFSTLFATLALVAGVSAHGYLGQITIDGKLYKGNGDGGDPSTTAIRPTKPYDVGPVKGASNPDLSCGLSPVQNAALQADANPGSNISVLWVGQGGINWIHKVGPVMHYMAECTGVPDCTTFDPSNAKWFKIDEKGLMSDGETWYMNNLFNGQPISLSIPQDLKAGNYLLRSEVIALHNAASEGGAEFYPNCAQLKVGGSGTGTGSPTVSFPGAYSDTDPGILVPGIYNPGFKYSFPGGVMASFSGSGSGSGSSPNPASSNGAEPTATVSAAATTSTPDNSAPGTPASTSMATPSSIAGNSTGTGRCGNNSARRRRREALHRRSKAKRGHAAANMHRSGRF